MRFRLVAIGILVASTAAASTAVASNDDHGGDSVLQVKLSGYNEDPLVLSTSGSGSFRVHIDTAGQEITYRLSYGNLEGTVQQAHIHIGGSAQSGGISVFLCTNLGNAPAGVPVQACPAAPATITGTLRPSDVIGPVAQGVEPGAFSELVNAIRAGKTYVNVHSTKYPGGEIRAQLEHHH